MEKALETYKKYQKKLQAYYYMMMIVGFDSSTIAPEGCFAKRGEHMAIVSEDLYKLETSEEYSNAIDILYKNIDQLDEVLQHEIKRIKRGIEKQKKIPMDEYLKFTELTAVSEQLWAKAKNNNDFESFRPTMEKIVEYWRKYLEWQESDEYKGFDILLEEHEKDYTSKEYDEFFNCLKEKLVPFVKKVVALPCPAKIDYSKYTISIQQQKAVCKAIEDIMCYDHVHGISAETEHPFTSGFGTYDVRYTNHFYEDNFVSSIYSAVHELGHATYELQCNPELDDTFSGGGCSMAMHESQSRFYENMIGRSREFVHLLVPVLEKYVPEIEWNEEDLYYYVNKPEMSYIRTEADELTYPLHIMLRYDLEKAMMSGELEVKDLPRVWNEKFKEYFGIEVPNVKVGCLQDVHWAGMSFGYFPTYALGSAYAAQFYKAMEKDIDIKKAVLSGTTKEINDWLKEHIHKYGSSKDPKDIMLLATGEEFNPNYYVDYLINKFSEMYNITE